MNFAQKYIFIVLHAKCDILYFRFIALQQFSGKCHINKDFVIYQLKLLCMAGLAIACLSLSVFLSLSPIFLAHRFLCLGWLFQVSKP